MPKSVPPSSLTIAGQTFTTNAVPDPFDERDFGYRPPLRYDDFPGHRGPGKRRVPGAEPVHHLSCKHKRRHRCFFDL